MSNPTGPDHNAAGRPQDADYEAAHPVVGAAPPAPVPPNAPPPPPGAVPPPPGPPPAVGADGPTVPSVDPNERRFTAPSGMDAGRTEIIARPPDPETEIIDVAGHQTNTLAAPKVAVPQEIPAREELPIPGRTRSRNWGWVFAIALVIAALIAIAVLGAMLLSRAGEPKLSPEQQVSEVIRSYDGALAKGDLTTLRSITCGTTAADYAKVDDAKWTETQQRIVAAGQNPVIASIDEVVINDRHAEANVTAYIAADPETRSTRSLDLQFQDDQWKICQDR